jgi:hypothetical protein
MSKNIFNKQEFAIIGDLKEQSSFYRCVLDMIEIITTKRVVHEGYEVEPSYFFDTTGSEASVTLKNEIFTLSTKETGILATYYIATKWGVSALVEQLDIVISDTLTKRNYNEFFVKVNWSKVNIKSLKST